MNLQLSSSSTTSRLVVDEDDLKLVKNKIKISFSLKNSCTKIDVLKLLDFRKLNHFSETQNDALIRRGVLKLTSIIEARHYRKNTN